MNLSPSRAVKGLILAICLLTGVIGWSFWQLENSFSKQERETLAAIAEQYKYDTIVGHVSPYDMALDSTRNPQTGTRYFKRPISNYIIAVVVSDSSLTYERLHPQAIEVDKKARTEILGNNTSNYNNVLIHY